MRYLTSLDQSIGSTPLLELCALEKIFDLNAKIFAKLEYFNPAGSVKDRIARAMIKEAEDTGKLRAGGVIIEPTSGNTGIGLAMVAAARGYKLIVVMPENMSEERRKLIAAYGAQVELTPAKEGMKGAIEKAKELVAQTPGSFMPSQFSNPANAEAHRRETAVEIYEATDGEISIFIAGVGTGGTITGVGEALKARKPSVEIIAVEPKGSPVLSGGQKGSHKIQGIGAGFVPELLNTEIIDRIIQVGDEEAMQTSRELAKVQGLLVGISAGAAVFAAIEVAKLKANAGKIIVALLADGGERYLSTGLYE